MNTNQDLASFIAEMNSKGQAIETDIAMWADEGVTTPQDLLDWYRNLEERAHMYTLQHYGE